MNAAAALQESVPPSPAFRVRSVQLPGPAGRLEGLWNEGSAQAPAAMLLCHPHPLAGGTMHNKVVYHAMKAANAPEFGLGLPVLRFHFRGVGLSQGTHDGHAEADDVLAALDFLRQQTDLPIVVAGFSFGAAMALTACCLQPDRAPRGVRAIAALGLPTHAQGRRYSYPFLAHNALPKLFLSGSQDPFAPPAELEPLVEAAAPPRRLHLVPGADHFFTGHLAAMQHELARWLLEQTYDPGQ